MHDLLSEVSKGRSIPRLRGSDRLLYGYYRRPLLGYFLVFGVTALWGLTPRSGELVGLLGFLFPWIAAGLVVLNLPLLYGLWQRLELDDPQRLNHALEHGTIYFLENELGKKKLGGRAEKRGFRVSGNTNPDEIRKAFKRFVDQPAQQRWTAAISRRCGSTMIVTQGIAILLLFASLGVFGYRQPPPLVVATVLAGQSILFWTLRQPFGRLLQRRRLLSVDFETARILKISKVAAKPLEKPPVHFVRTSVVHRNASAPGRGTGLAV